MYRLLMLALLTSNAAFADSIFYCTRTETSPGGIVLSQEPCTPGHGGSGFAQSSFFGIGGSLAVAFQLSTGPSGPNAVSIDGFAETNWAGYFVVTGGTGGGKLTGLADTNADAFNFGASGFIDTFDSNFLLSPRPFGPYPAEFDFMFGVPFLVYIHDSVRFSAASPAGGTPSAAIFVDYNSSVNYTSILDANNNVVPGAGVVATTPEPGTLALTIIGMIMFWRSLRYRRPAGPRLR